MQIGLSIRELRLKRGLSTKELAEKSGVSHHIILDIENGFTTPTFYQAQHLIHTLEAKLMIKED